jgi:hypothetical protein
MLRKAGASEAAIAALGDGVGQATNPEPALANIPAELRERRQWVVWRGEERDGKATKVPYRASDPTRKASSTNRRTWSTFEQAQAAWQRGDCDGVGFVFASDDPFVGCDLDHCRAAETSELVPVAAGIAAAFATYQEASVSGSGVHVIMRGAKPPGAGCKRPFEDIEVELYESGRYFCMTGDQLGKVPEVCDCQAALEELCALVWPPKVAQADRSPRTTPAERLDDRELIAKMLAASNGHNVTALYLGDTSAYGDDHSRADAALLGHLAWWTNGDPEQMNRIFRSSGLYREKWDRADYAQRSIAFAIEANGGQGYSARPAAASAAHEAPDEQSAGRATNREPIDEEPPEQPGAASAEPPTRRKIVVTNRPLRDVSDEAIAGLCAVNDPPALFSQSPFIVRLRQDAGQRLRIEQVGDDALRYQLTGAVDFMTKTKDGELKHTNPPRDVLRNINATPDPPFPSLETLRTSPMLRRDFTIVTQTGYDPESRVFYAPPPGFVLPPLPPLREAVRWLDEALGAFCYADDGASRANAYALLLTPLLRLVLRGNVPLAVINSSQQGSGKTCLASVISIIATGAAPSTVSEPEDDAEWRKMLTSALRRGDELLIIDNIDRTLRSPRLAEFITTEWWTDRLLGGNEMPSLAQRMTVMVTGNNVALGGDLGRRCYLIVLDAKCARPWVDRQYPHPDLLEWTAANRAPLLASALALIHTWAAAGRPQAKDVPRLGNFGDWCQVIGSILAHADIAGFLGNLESVYSALDVEASQWEGLLAALWDQRGSQPFTSAQVAADLALGGALHEHVPDALDWALQGKSEGLVIRLGKALRKQVGRRYGARNLSLANFEDAHGKKNLWVVKEEQAQ